MSKQYPVIYWFRQDLRLKDNPGLSEAAQVGLVIPIYILDDKCSGGAYRMGEASRLWLHHSLSALNTSLDGHLCFFVGAADQLLPKLVKQYRASAVYWSRCYEPWRIQRDKKIETQLKKQGVDVHTYNASLLWEPGQILKKDGTPYKVFTAFYKAALHYAPPPDDEGLRSPKLHYAKTASKVRDLSQLGLETKRSWKAPILAHWSMGEKAADQRLRTFLKTGIHHYHAGRNFPAQSYVSCLSPHLHFGEISPHRVWASVRKMAANANQNTTAFLSELGWREFSYDLLYHFPQLPKKNLQTQFDHFPWEKQPSYLRAWQQGMTGYPIVDAGMRQLWQIGWMHNRVRMIVGSFLVKNLLLHWHQGERWFWDCLVDADLASNSASWQWVSGSGADAAPYFRIFNPVLQGQKFDSEGEYTRHYVPELVAMPKRYLFNPWQAPTAVLEKAGVILGKTYPLPIVDLNASRARALRAFKQLKQGGK